MIYRHHLKSWLKKVFSIIILFNLIIIFSVILISAKSTFSINSIAGTGGTISPSGITNIESGGTQTYIFTPGQMYNVFNVYIDNVSIGSVTNYTFYNVLSDHTIYVTFTYYPPLTFKYINASSTPGGKISPEGNLAISANIKNQAFTITSDPGYGIIDVLVDNVSQGQITSYTFTNINANHKIFAIFGEGSSVTDDYDPIKEAICQKNNQTITLNLNCGTIGCNWTRYCLESGCDPTNGIDYNGTVIIGKGKTFFRYQSKSNSGALQSLTERIFVVDPNCFSNPNYNVNYDNLQEINDTDYEIQFKANFTGQTRLSVRETDSEPYSNPGYVSIGRFLEIVAPDLESNITSAFIKLKYDKNKLTELGVDESTLGLWYYNITTSSWSKLFLSNETINKEENFVSTHANHFSIWGIFGSVPAPPVSGSSGGSSSGGGGGGGGGGGKRTESCNITWICTDWNPCINNIQTRNCTKKENKCYSGTKPAESQNCIIKLVNSTNNSINTTIKKLDLMNKTEEPLLNKSLNIDGILNAANNKKLIVATEVIFGILLIAILVFLMMFNKKKKINKKHK